MPMTILTTVTKTVTVHSEFTVTYYVYEKTEIINILKEVVYSTVYQTETSYVEKTLPTTFKITETITLPTTITKTETSIIEKYSTITIASTITVTKTTLERIASQEMDNYLKNLQLTLLIPHLIIIAVSATTLVMITKLLRRKV